MVVTRVRPKGLQKISYHGEGPCGVFGVTISNLKKDVHEGDNEEDEWFESQSLIRPPLILRIEE